MTTVVRVSTNGNYVSEGILTIAERNGATRGQPVKVGPGTPAEQSFNVPHLATYSLMLTERPATDDEIAALKAAKEAAENQGI